jgi:cell division protein FtsW (lipid II flippase)
MIGLCIVIIVAGFLLWLALRFIPMEDTVKKILVGVVVLLLLVYILNAIGLLPVHDVPVPRVRN